MYHKITLSVNSSGNEDSMLSSISDSEVFIFLYISCKISISAIKMRNVLTCFLLNGHVVYNRLVMLKFGQVVYIHQCM